MNYRRIKQVLYYGWRHAKEAVALANTHNRVWYYVDILLCYHKYRMWSNQYIAERFYELHGKAREAIGDRYRLEGRNRDIWERIDAENMLFYIKYSNVKYSYPASKYRRQTAYAERYHAGENLMVENNVFIARHHYLLGEISIGNNVYLASNVHIDYSGGVTIEDDVQITNGCIIETHAHCFHGDWTKSKKDFTTNHLIIKEGAVLGTKSVILSGCSYIGINARIGAGAVVTKDVPDYAVVVGVPAKVLKINKK